ncbi:MAG: HlyC/CorC family transporter [Armatimonadetes bacterium]|nr:HlyC/CorC family transporter [Armatimonadota bacterium]
MSPGDLRPVFTIAVLLMISGLFSAAELSFLALGRRRARKAVEGRAGALLGRLLERPGATLGAILITITAVNYTAEVIAANWVLTGLHQPLWIAIAGMAVLVLIFAEVVPISYAAANPERVGRSVIVPIWVATRVLALPARAIGFVAEWITRLLGGGPGTARPITEGEIRAIVDLQAETGGLEEEEKVMIHQIFEFGDKVAREVMVPRTDMVAIPDTATADDAARAATEHRISRLPVYRDNLDTIIGTTHVKDVIPLLAAGKDATPVTSVMLDPLRVPETKRLSDLLAEFRRRRRTLAIVVDEYGGTAGLVTLEDLLEEVVGDIYDEYDEVRPAIEHTIGGSIILDGRMSIGEASAALGVELPEGDYDSLAGLLYAHLGVVPRTGDEVDIDGVQLVVDELEGHRIVRVRAVLSPKPEEEPEKEGGV